MNDPLAAYAYLDFVPVLIQLQTEATHTWLQLNSTRSDNKHHNTTTSDP